MVIPVAQMIRKSSSGDAYWTTTGHKHGHKFNLYPLPVLHSAQISFQDCPVLVKFKQGHPEKNPVQNKLSYFAIYRVVSLNKSSFVILSS